MMPSGKTRNATKSESTVNTKTLKGKGKQDGGPGVNLRSKSTSDNMSDTASSLSGLGDDAPEEIECKICNSLFTDVEDKLIECERCEKWECLSCSKLSSDQYDILTTGATGVHWYCNDCNFQAVQAVKTDNDIEEKCKQYFESVKAEIGQVRSELGNRITSEIGQIHSEMHDIKKQINSHSDSQLRADIDELKEQFKGLEAASGSINEQQLGNCTEECIQEMHSREDRKLNLMFFDIPESDKDESIDRKEDDTNFVKTVLKSIDIEIPLENVVRVGQKEPGDSRNRPIKIKTKTLDRKSVV